MVMELWKARKRAQRALKVNAIALSGEIKIYFKTAEGMKLNVGVGFDNAWQDLRHELKPTIRER